MKTLAIEHCIAAYESLTRAKTKPGEARAELATLKEFVCTLGQAVKNETDLSEFSRIVTEAYKKVSA